MSSDLWRHYTYQRRPQDGDLGHCTDRMSALYGGQKPGRRIRRIVMIPAHRALEIARYRLMSRDQLLSNGNLSIAKDYDWTQTTEYEDRSFDVL